MKIKNPFTIENNLGQVTNFKRLREEGTSFFLGKNKTQLYQAISKPKLKIIFWFILIFAGLIFGRIVWLQIIRGSDYSAISTGNRIRLETIPAERGIIYDRFGQPLVANIPSYALYYTPADLPDSALGKKYLAKKLSQMISKDYEEIDYLFQNTSEYSYQKELLIDNLNHEEAISLAVVTDTFPGIQVLAEPQREYLENTGLSHVLGYVGKIDPAELTAGQKQGYLITDYIGKNGVELFYENILRGKHGQKEIEVDAIGKPKKTLNISNPVIGDSIVLSINVALQKKITASLSQAIASAPKSKGGVGIALDPKSGEILALVSLPNFDNNFFSAGINKDAYANYLNDPAQPLFNRAISGTYPPGSIFKPVVGLAALEEGIIDKDKTFLSTGGLSIGQWFFPDWKVGGHGRINIIKAIAESVNTFFYYIGGGYSDFTGLGVAKITAFARKLNLAQTLGIDLPNEAPGFLPSQAWKEEYKNESWYIGDTYHLAIGQGDVLVTPLQIASYTAAIANGGTLWQPHLLKEIKPASGSKSDSKSSIPDYIINQNIAKPENIEIIKQGLRATVVSGSAQSLNDLPVLAAGKTGTAQVGGDQENHAWFTGFAPYESPQIVLTILIENGGEGSSVAVPVFKEVIDWYFSANK